MKYLPELGSIWINKHRVWRDNGYIVQALSFEYGFLWVKLKALYNEESKCVALPDFWANYQCVEG